MTDKSKRREWVKTAAIVFLTFLLVLTFFSGTIQNYYLPEVAVQYASSGNVSAGIRASGIVSASRTYVIPMEETRTVRTVLVRNGDEVAAGDILIELEDSESEELVAAREQLKQLQDAYNRALLGLSSIDTTEAANAIENATTALNRAKQEKTAYEASLASSPEKRAADDAKRVLESLQQWQQLTQDAASMPGVSDAVAIDYFAAYIGVQPEELFQQPEEPLEEPQPADTAYENVKEEYKAYASVILAAAKADVEAANWTLKQMAAQYDDAIAAADQALEAARRNYDEAVKNAQASQQLQQMDLAQQQQAIAKQREVVDELAAKAVDAVITARQAGTVTDLAAVAGEKLSAGTNVCTIQLADTDFTAEISLTAQQASRIQVGQSATVSGYYWGQTPRATVTSIRTDPNVRGNRLVTLSLTGAVEPGGSYNFVLGETNSAYDVVVPRSAVHEDNTGTFVLLVTNKATPLGTRYYATRVDVTVLATDDTRCAVLGEFSGWDYVITSASAPVESGDQVRLANS